MRRIGKVYCAVIQQQPRPAELGQRVKGNVPQTIIAVAGARDAGLNQHRSAEFFRPGGHIQGMQPVHVICHARRYFLCFRLNVDGASGRVDDRGAGDADFWNEVAAIDVAIGNGSNSPGWIDKTDLPQWHGVRTRVAVGVKRVDTVVLGGDIQYVMDAVTRDGDVGQDQWLSVYVPVDGVGK